MSDPLPDDHRTIGGLPHERPCPCGHGAHHWLPCEECGCPGMPTPGID